MARQVPSVKLSKTLSYLLRHGASEQGLTVHTGGFVYIEDLLRLPQLHQYTVQDIQDAVSNNEKQRFCLEENPENHRLWIRANQGHSMKVEGLQMHPVQSHAEFPTVLHGTTRHSWQIIKQQGLHRMGRTHIHFAPGEPGESGVLSGMRKSCSVLIFLDLRKALADGISFYVSANNVILSPGDQDGYIQPKYFDYVLDRETRERLTFDKGC